VRGGPDSGVRRHWTGIRVSPQWRGGIRHPGQFRKEKRGSVASSKESELPEKRVVSSHRTERGPEEGASRIERIEREPRGKFNKPKSRIKKGGVKQG